jgi:hypothetical protein
MYNAITRFHLLYDCNKDGTSIIAIDGISGGLLWKRQIEIMLMLLARKARSLTVDVIEESEVFTNGDPHGRNRMPSSVSPSKSHRVNALVPLDAYHLEPGQFHALKFELIHAN